MRKPATFEELEAKLLPSTPEASLLPFWAGRALFAGYTRRGAVKFLMRELIVSYQAAMVATATAVERVGWELNWRMNANPYKPADRDALVALLGTHEAWEEAVAERLWRGETFTAVCRSLHLGVARGTYVAAKIGWNYTWRNCTRSTPVAGRMYRECRAAAVAPAVAVDLYHNQGQTLQQIGDTFGISRERVRQILASTGVQYYPHKLARLAEVKLTKRQAQVDARAARTARRISANAVNFAGRFKQMAKAYADGEPLISIAAHGKSVANVGQIIHRGRKFGLFLPKRHEFGSTPLANGFRPWLATPVAGVYRGQYVAFVPGTGAIASAATRDDLVDSLTAKGFNPDALYLALVPEVLP